MQLLLLPLYPAAYLCKLYRTLFPGPVPVLPHLRSKDGTYSQCWRNFAKVHEDRISNCEDLVIWERHRLAILSTEPSRATFNPFTAQGRHSEADNGKLQVYHLDSGRLEDVQIEDWPPGRALHPLGINLLEAGDGVLLGIANCPEGPCSVELLHLAFLQESETIHARYVRSFTHRSIGSPNAIVLLSEKEVLFSNSFGISPRTSSLLNTLEQSLAFPGGSVKLLTAGGDGKVSCKTVISGIPLANGLALSSDRNVLAVASTMGQRVSLYDVKDGKSGIRSTRQLHHRKDVAVGFLVDNLHFAEHKDNPFGAGSEAAGYTLLCAGHPSALQYLATAKHPLARPISSSRVVKLNLDAAPGAGSLCQQAKGLFSARGKEVALLFESRGDFFGTSSTAAAYTTSEGKQAMLICGLWQKGLLRCEDVAI